MVVLVNAAAFECLELPLPTKNTFQGNLSSLYIHITLCNYEGRHKNGWIQQMLNKNSVPQRSKRLNLPQLPPLVGAFPFFRHCLYSGGADLLQETSKAVRGKMFTFLSKLLFENFQQWLPHSDLFAMPALLNSMVLAKSYALFPCRYGRGTAGGDW